MRPYALSEPRLLACAVVASIVLQMTALAIPLLSKHILDGLDRPASGAHVRTLGIAALAIVASTIALQAIRSMSMLYVQTRADATLTVGLFRHLLTLPYRFAERRGTGDLNNRLASSAVIRESLTRQSSTAVLDGVTALGLLTCIVVLDLPSGLVVGSVSAAAVAGGLLAGRRGRELAAAEAAAEAESQRYVLEALSGIQSLKAAGAETRVAEHWRRLFEDRQRAGLRRGRAGTAIDLVGTAAQTLAPALLLWINGARVVAGTMTVGTMVAVSTLAATTLVPLIAVVTGLQRLQFVGSLVDRLADVLDAEPERTDGRALPAFSGAIDLRDVSFRYAVNSPLALERCSMSIAAGSTVAIVGRSGAGKSTLANLLVLLHEPTAGIVRFDGVPSRELQLGALRRRCGVVLQDPALFSGSIKDNIALHDPTMSLDCIVEAAKLAAIHDEIVRLPMGYATQLADHGAGLSGGQRQRIALARALAARPAVLVLDEATSHLDVVTEAAVDRAIRTIGCTRVIIAHRLSTVRAADEIIVLDAGRIVERGTHDELLDLAGHYASLVTTQVHVES